MPKNCPLQYSDPTLMDFILSKVAADLGQAEGLSSHLPIMNLPRASDGDRRHVPLPSAVAWPSVRNCLDTKVYITHTQKEILQYQILGK